MSEPDPRVETLRKKLDSIATEYHQFLYEDTALSAWIENKVHEFIEYRTREIEQWERDQNAGADAEYEESRIRIENDHEERKAAIRADQLQGIKENLNNLANDFPEFYKHCLKYSPTLFDRLDIHIEESQPFSRANYTKAPHIGGQPAVVEVRERSRLRIGNTLIKVGKKIRVVFPGGKVVQGILGKVTEDSIDITIGGSELMPLKISCFEQGILKVTS